MSKRKSAAKPAGARPAQPAQDGRAAARASSDANSEEAENDVLPIALLAPDPRNPRRIDGLAAEGLGVSLETFGSIDGITFNLRTGELVAGHQRMNALKAAGATKVVRPAGGEWGYVLHPKTGERFPVRFVDWDKTKQRLGNLAANNPKIQGEYTDDVVEQLHEVEGAAEYEALRLDDLLEDLRKDEEKVGDDGGGSEDQSGDLADSWQIVVSRTSEAHQRKLLERFEAEGLACRALI